MTPFRIILDIDDVLNSLTLHLMQHFGCEVGIHEYSAFPVEAEYDVIRALGILGVEPLNTLNVDIWDDVTVPMFWNEVTRADLWRTIPKSPQCDSLLDTCAELVGKEQVFLATTPTKCPQAHAHKLEWIWENLPEWIHRQYFLTPRKWLLGKPGVLLIDDNEDNCIKFREEGGQAICLPRPWNRFHSADTNTSLAFSLSLLFPLEKRYATNL